MYNPLEKCVAHGFGLLESLEDLDEDQQDLNTYLCR